MKRSRLRNKFLYAKSDINRKAYNKQNFYSKLNTWASQTTKPFGKR